MRIVVATPLYPPDIAQPAPYVKELVSRLGKDAVVLTYGHLPEQVAGVDIVAIDKRFPLPVRLFLYTRALWRQLRTADVLYLQNGPSVELPALIALAVRRTPLVVHIADKAAHDFAHHHGLRRVLERMVFSRARAIVTNTPPLRPEILPLEAYPTTQLETWEQTWHNHLSELTPHLHVS